MLEKFEILEESNNCGVLISEHEQNLEMHYDVTKQTVVESVYSVVRTDSLHTADYVRSLKG